MLPNSRNGKSKQKLIAIMVDRESIKYLSFNTIIFMKNFLCQKKKITIFHGQILFMAWRVYTRSISMKQLFGCFVSMRFVVVVAIETFCVLEDANNVYKLMVRLGLPSISLNQL